MTTVCYTCHTKRTDVVKVAEDAQQAGFDAMRSGDEDKAVASYRQAAQILSEIPDLRCKQHVPPLFCVGVREREFDGDWVWLPGVMGPHITICECCFKKRPCIDCNTVAANPAWAKARPWKILEAVEALPDYGKFNELPAETRAPLRKFIEQTEVSYAAEKTLEELDKHYPEVKRPRNG